MNPSGVCPLIKVRPKPAADWTVYGTFVVSEFFTATKFFRRVRESLRLRRHYLESENATLQVTGKDADVTPERSNA